MTQVKESDMHQLLKGLCVLAISLFITSCAFNYPKLDAYEDELSADVYFVPIGLVAPEYLIALADYYQKNFKLKVGVTERLSITKSAWNEERRQLKSDYIIRQMKYQYWNHSFNPDAVYIGITHKDLYLPEDQAKSIFAYRIGRNFSVVSNHRLEGKSGWSYLDIETVNSRFRKVVSKTIGTLHFDKPLNTNSKSVLYNNIKSLLDLDYIDEKTIYSDILAQKPIDNNLSVKNMY